MKYSLKLLAIAYAFCFAIQANASNMRSWVRSHLNNNPYNVLPENIRDAVDLAYEYKEQYVDSRASKSVRGKKLGFYCRKHCTRDTCTGDKKMAKLCREICIDHSNNKDNLNQKCLNKSVLMSGLKRFSKGFSRGVEFSANLANTAGEYRRAVDPYYTGKKTYEVFNPQTGEMEIVEYDDSLTNFGKSAQKINKTKKELTEITRLRKKYPNMTYKQAQKAERSKKAQSGDRKRARTDKFDERRERVKKRQRTQEYDEDSMDIDLEEVDDPTDTEAEIDEFIDIEDDTMDVDSDHVEHPFSSESQHQIVQVDFSKQFGTVF